MGNAWPLALCITVILAFWLFWEVQGYLVDAARQAIFEHRNSMFILAAQGHVSFDDPTYLAFRRSLNGMIRYAHRADFLDLTYLASVFGVLEAKHPSAIQLISQIADEELAKEFRSRYSMAVVAILKVAILRSPFVTFLAVGWMAVRNINRVMAKGVGSAWCAFRDRLNIAVERQSSVS